MYIYIRREHEGPHGQPRCGNFAGERRGCCGFRNRGSYRGSGKISAKRFSRTIMILKAKIWKFGDSLAATDVLSSQYDRMGLSGQWNECAKHLLETIDPDFATCVE